MKPLVRDAVAVVCWSLFWVFVVLGVAVLVIEWQVLQRGLGF